jgi:3-phenylpropionate/trans-cinnamate dioxygenase ferredoxin subunit
MSEWVWVAELADISPDGGLRVVVDDVPLALWRVDGEVYATQDTCTHEEASLSEGDLWGDIVDCPMHGAQFNVRTGEVLSLPALFPLATFPVKVQDDDVYVEWSGPR